MRRYQTGLLARGQTAVIFALVIPVFVLATALGADVAVEYYSWGQLQKAADAAVLAGANYLPDNTAQAITSANQFAQANGVAGSEITSTTVATNNLSISINLRRTVPYYFARVIGLTNAAVSTQASASAQFAPSTINASTPSQIPAGGDNNGNNGTTCSGIGQCGLTPIGLDSNTVYSDGAQVTLQQGEVGPGNWDLLALGGVGANNLRANIANGYNGEVSVGDWVTTEPGQKVGPVDQGFQDRLNQALIVDPGGTSLSHNLSNPRVLIVPVVDWEHQSGRNSVKVTAFASVWLDSYSGGQVTVHFISQVVPNSFGSPTAPNFGARGTPMLAN